MSSDIYAEPALSKKVRSSRKEQEDGADWEQREVDIYESTDDVRDIDTNTQEEEPQTQNHPPVQKIPNRCAIRCLSVMCLLMLAGIIILSIHFALKISHLETKYSDMNKNYTQLLTKLLGTMSEHDQLRTNYIQLQEELKKRRNTKDGMGCSKGWLRFGCSCYFKSDERKTWSDSRRDCQSKGADLVIINSEEEQKFVSENMKGESWIGLGGKSKDKWVWVDGSPLTEPFWASKHQHLSGWTSAVYCGYNGKWIPSNNSESKSWICEKLISSCG